MDYQFTMESAPDFDSDYLGKLVGELEAAATTARFFDCKSDQSAYRSALSRVSDYLIAHGKKPEEYLPYYFRAPDNADTPFQIDTDKPLNLKTAEGRKRLFHALFDGRPCIMLNDWIFEERDPCTINAQVSRQSVANYCYVQDLFSSPSNTLYGMEHPRIPYSPGEEPTRLINAIRGMISRHGVTPTDGTKIVTFHSESDYDIEGVTLWLVPALSADWAEFERKNFHKI